VNVRSAVTTDVMKRSLPALIECVIALVSEVVEEKHGAEKLSLTAMLSK